MTRSLSFLPLLLLCCLGVVGVGSSAAHAQSPSLTLTSQEPPIRVAVEPVFESVTHDGQTLTQASTQLVASVPVRRNVQASVRASIARSAGEDLTTVGGLDDVQIGASYARALPLGSVVVAVDASLPTGRRNLAAEEWQTAILVSQNIYDFQIGGFGQGLNVEPRVTWAVPVQDNVMLGIGAGYTYRGAYDPAETLRGAYNPGDEVEVFGGADIRFAQHHAVSGDLSFTRFGTDTVEGENRYEARYKLAGTIQYLFQRDFTTVRVIGRLQHWPESRVFVPNLGLGAEPTFDDRQVVPSEWSLRATGSSRVIEWMDVQMTLVGQRFDQTVVQDDILVGTARLAPRFRLPGNVYVTPGIGYSLGDVERLDVRLRTEVQF